jgi:hypothetical protein
MPLYSEMLHRASILESLELLRVYRVDVLNRAIEAQEPAESISTSYAACWFAGWKYYTSLWAGSIYVAVSSNKFSLSGLFV